jgi:hypothetical protein
MAKAAWRRRKLKGISGLAIRNEKKRSNGAHLASLENSMK